MTNKEKFRDELENYVLANVHWGVRKSNNKICYCSGGDMNCTKCIFGNSGDCEPLRMKWLDEEYTDTKIKWNKIKVDTKILVSDDGETWYKRHFCKYEDGKVYAFSYGNTSWSVQPGYNQKCIPFKYAILADESEEK